MEAARREGLLASLPKPVPIERLLELLRVARRDGLAVVIDDDTAMCDNLCETLRGRGFAAVTAASVLETERAMQRLGAKYPGLPMLVVSGYHDELPLPHVGFFSKPFDTSVLLEAIERQYQQRAS